ncbi:hypothetical protein RQP46_004807 [Phenoliferia psychrophenolica]
MPPTFQLYDQPSRPQSPSFHINAVVDLHATLYGGAGKDRAAISALVWDMYDTNAVFENPVTMARGPETIVDLFSLLGVVPGDMWSELGDICESPSYVDGSRLVTVSHTLHYRLLGSSSPTATSAELRASDSFYSVPTHHAVSEEGRWPLSHILRQLRPRNIVDHLSTLNIKLYSRLEFNETGRITRHEDVIGIRETIEGVFPILGHVYSLNRQGLGFLASTASRLLLRTKAPDPEALREAEFHRSSSTLFIPTSAGFRREIVSPQPMRKLAYGASSNGSALGLEDLEPSIGVATVDRDECYNTE